MQKARRLKFGVREPRTCCNAAHGKELLMAIHELMSATVVGGHVTLICRECRAPAVDAASAEDVTLERILKVCSHCGMPLGEWATEAERDAELRGFVARAKQHSARRVTKGARIYRTKQESKSKSMPRGSGGRKQKTKYGRKRGGK
jgi:hypothetical protein